MLHDFPLTIGQTASTARTFELEDVRAFAELSGDNNPLHLDPEYTQHTSFGRPIVHGILTASLFSRLLGTALPGPGTIYLGQLLKFLQPVYVGEEVTATVEVTDIRMDKRIVTLRTTAITAHGLAIDGEAVVQVAGPAAAAH
jgi:acyl dehydratase